MSNFDSDILTSKHQREFARLRGSRSGSLLRSIVLYSCIAAALIFTYYTIFSQGSDEAAFQKLRRELLSVAPAWSRDLSSQELTFENWLQEHGTVGEKDVFQIVCTGVFHSALSYIERSGNDAGSGFLGKVYIALHFALMRISFIVISCWRLWLLIVAISCYFGYKSRSVYYGADVLGQTGNGRIFYSGIRAGLDKLSKGGAPNLQVRGLACPAQASATKTQGSALGQILQRYNVANETNKNLAAIIVEHEKWPGYVAQIDEDALLENYFNNSSLPENSANILEKILDLHVFYQNRKGNQKLAEALEKDNEQGISGKLNSLKYAHILQKALNRVVTPAMIETIARIPVAQVATTVLAYEAGKTLAYAREGGKWLRKSNYSQLSARAVLHSVEAFASEYDFEERTLIRRALIFGARASAFGPVKAPVDLSDESRALRQWVEVLMACPYELEEVANEVEMFGIICEAHAQWNQLFLDAVMMGESDAVEGVYGGSGNLILLPLTKLMNIAKKCIDINQLTRLEALANLVCQQQKLNSLSSGSNSGEPLTIPAYAKVLPALREDEIRSLSKNYGVSYQLLREWSTMRIVLNNFGWLARRVGDYSVSESSIIYAVMQPEQEAPGANALGLIGVPGMVPIRATRLEERWGKSWPSRFTQISKATMAENLEDYQKLMRGEALDEFEDTTIVNA